MSNSEMEKILTAIDGLEERVNQKVVGLEERMSKRFDGIETDIVGVRFFMQGLASSVKNLENFQEEV